MTGGGGGWGSLEHEAVSCVGRHHRLAKRFAVTTDGVVKESVVAGGARQYVIVVRQLVAI